MKELVYDFQGGDILYKSFESLFVGETIATIRASTEWMVLNICDVFL